MALARVLLHADRYNFAIDTEVENSSVHLTGTVKSDIDRDLAIELAKGADGVVEVNEDLVADAEAAVSDDEPDADDNDRTFRTLGRRCDDDGRRKVEAGRKQQVAGLQIDVDTRGDIVTLSGRVDSDEQTSLAEELARNSGDVRDVRNNLVVDAQYSHSYF